MIQTNQTQLAQNGCPRKGWIGNQFSSAADKGFVALAFIKDMLYTYAELIESTDSSRQGNLQ